MTTADVAVRNGHNTAALAIRPGQEMFSDKQRAALAVLGIKDASNADLAVYMHYCQKTGLDPFSRQIYMIARREKQGDQWVVKQTIQVGIDGFRVIRDRIARREGISVEYEDTIWYDATGEAYGVWLFDEPPTACKVTVIKDGRRFPAVVRTAAYAATNRDGDMIAQWRTQPDHMIEKCAEAFALRRAFPHDLGGLYIDEEMPQAPPVMPARPQRVTRAEIVGEPQTSGPAVPDGQTRAPAAGPETQGGPADPPAARATKAQTGQLENLLAKFPWQDSDKLTFLEWRCNGPYRATKTQAAHLTAYLGQRLEDAGGDTEEALSAIWAEYRATQDQDAAEAAAGTGDGHDDG